METHQCGGFSSRSQVRQQSDFRGLRSFLFPERRGQHLTDLGSPSRDLHNVGGDRGGSEPLHLGSDCDTSHTDPQGQAKSTELIDRLVKVHLYLRLIPGSLLMIVTALMMYQVLSAAS
jgi:hypothetical protein